MKKILYLLIGILLLNCESKPNNSGKFDLAINSKLKSIEIEYSESREKTIENLKKIWNCEFPLIAKSEKNYNGKITNDISLMITGIKPIENETKKKNITLTINLIKKSILNYKEFSELQIITSYTTSDGERRTSNRTIKMAEL
jgi:hypothetical protein